MNTFKISTVKNHVILGKLAPECKKVLKHNRLTKKAFNYLGCSALHINNYDIVHYIFVQNIWMQM